MAKQYPHTLFVKFQAGNSVQEPSGEWTNQPETWVFHSECREETNGKGAVINGAGGTAIVFSSTVYMPKTAVRIPEGAEVFVSASPLGLDRRIKGQVLKFDVGQLNCRLWV